MDDIQTATDRERAARFTAFYARDHPRVSAFAHRRVGDRRTAEELTAEVFRIAWERTLGGEEVSTGWLFVTARNLLSNHHRATARLTELHRRITDELDRVPASGEDSAVLETLERLPARHRDVLLLRYWDGLNASETAEVLGCSVPAVWVRLHRAREAFRGTYAPPAHLAREGSPEESS
ncbi:RNA polymerase sigma factor [Streptomyces hirsutus]|uniref:RNA polymerase sigma factor n=1 Tax=Streptomyces hirsutus TaxID=35620 RepID=UPI003656E7EE